MHALIIEDNAIITAQLADELRQRGFTSVDCADTCAEAIERAAKHRPDLITVDHWLGGESGINAIQEICANRRIPVVYVVALPDLVLAEVPDAVVVQKPFTKKHLDKAIAAVLT